MKTWSCLHCRDSISEFGGYVKISVGSYSHLLCYNKAVAQDVRTQDVASHAQKLEDDALRHTNDAVAVWRAAPRCPKCGVPMLPERPAALPAEFSTVLQGSGGVCGPCVRQEVSLRVNARALTQRVEYSLEEKAQAEGRLRREQTSTEDQELIRKARETGNPTIEVE